MILSRILRLGIGLLLNLVYFAASVFPRDSTRWVFGAWNGKKYLDNPKYVFLNTLQTAPEVRAIWITRCPSLAREMLNEGLPAAYAGSLAGIWAQLRAGVVVFSHSVEWDLWAPLVARRVLRVQTWHGMPIKHIGYDDKKDVSPKRARWITRIYPYRDDRLDLVTAAGPADQACYRTAFNVHHDAVIITGYPRNDALFRSSHMEQACTGTAKHVIYMPTLRGAAYSEFPLFESSFFDFDTVDAECRKLGVHLWIKLHPVQKFRDKDLVRIAKCNNIHAFVEAGDIYESMNKFDILITDFSGIYFDFMITGRPIILAPLDMAGYIANDRSLYYAYNDLCWEPPCVSWEQVLARLRVFCTPKIEMPEGYHHLRTRFHTYMDGRSAQRVALSIKQLSLRRRTQLEAEC